jgi:hypothetical protein
MKIAPKFNIVVIITFVVAAVSSVAFSQTAFACRECIDKICHDQGDYVCGTTCREVICKTGKPAVIGTVTPRVQSHKH